MDIWLYTFSFKARNCSNWDPDTDILLVKPKMAPLFSFSFVLIQIPNRFSLKSPGKPEMYEQHCVSNVA